VEDLLEFGLRVEETEYLLCRTPEINNRVRTIVSYWLWVIRGDSRNRARILPLGQVSQIKQLTDSILIFEMIMPSSGVALNQLQPYVKV
jgi:hypothetical protein